MAAMAAGVSDALVIQQGNADGTLSVSIDMPECGSARPPIDLVCVVDISGSMGLDAAIETQGTEQHGLSILDVVRHAVRTVLHILGPEDQAALVTFHTTAETVFDLTKMTPEGRGRAEALLDALRPKEQTNLWDGLHRGLELLRSTPAGARRNSAVLLFTDGVPNNSPDIGNLPALQKYKQEHGRLPLISTFGFGYDLDSKLLEDIATEACGSYAFMPDAGLVGTVLVNAASNLMASVAADLQLIITPTEGAAVTEGPGGFPLARTADGRWVIELGTLQEGQPRQFVLRMEGQAAQVVLAYRDLRDGKQHEIPAGHMASDLPLAVARVRLRAVACISESFALMVSGTHDAGPASASALAAELRDSGATSDPAVGAICEDLEGQVMEALSRKDWFEKWGRHYLPSLARAHVLQQCNNFKDPGVQVYGGNMFKAIRDDADEKFCELPPPKGRDTSGGLDPEFLSMLPPDVRAEVEMQHRMEQQRAAAPAATARPTNMTAFYDRCGG